MEEILKQNTELKLLECKTVKEPIIVNNIIFILFAEFLGYNSRFIPWCEDLCNGEKYPRFALNIINVEAKIIFKEMLKTFSVENIRYYYDKFYNIILKKYEDKLIGAKDDNSDLPF